MPAILWLCLAVLGGRDDKVAPFDGVVWQDGHPVVHVDGEWFVALTIDGVAVADLLEHSRKAHGSRWQKRFVEDLPQLLREMGHPPGAAVSMKLRHADTGQVQERAAVAMTSVNRRLVRQAAEARLTTRDAVDRFLTARAREDEPEYPELAPFQAVRWNDGHPEIRVADRWYQARRVGDVPVADILDHARAAHGSRWQKRFGEDLVQLLIEMGHEVGPVGDLTVYDAEAERELVLRDVKWTAENRRAVWNHNHAGEGPDAVRLTPADVPRVRREHADRVPPEWRDVVKRMALGRTPVLSADQVAEDLDQLEHALVHQYSYLKLRGVDYRAGLDAIRATAGDDLERGDFALQIARFLARFGDGHTRVEESLQDGMPAGSLPFLIAPGQDGWVAFQADRSALLDADRPYVKSLEGGPIHDWLRTAAALSAEGHEEFRLARGARNLRQFNWARRELNLRPSSEVTVELVNARGKGSRVQKLGLADKSPVYGDWPRREHALLDGNVGYLRIPSMTSDPRVLAGLRDRMQEFRDTDGLVIDVRGNGGGSRDILRLLFPYFLAPEAAPVVVNFAAKRLVEGESATDSLLENRFLYPARHPALSPAHQEAVAAFAAQQRPEWALPAGEFSDWHYFVIGPRDEPAAYHYERPVVILQDQDCFSATDIFLGAFEGHPDVTRLGTTSGGGSGRSQLVVLAHSMLPVRLSSMASFRPNGRLYDGRGIPPDLEVRAAPTDFIGATDTLLDAALEHLRRR